MNNKIIAMKRAETSGSGAPFWRCTLQDGERVNVFQHPDPAKDTFHLFHEYGPEMTAMVKNEEITWVSWPIGVELRKKGEWWEVVGVEARLTDSEADDKWAPDVELVRGAVTQQAQALMGAFETVVFLDTETTGIGPDAEVVSVAVAIVFPDDPDVVSFHTLVKPNHPEKLAAGDEGSRPMDIHGITPEMVANAPTFKDVYQQDLVSYLDGVIWVIYNAGYDAPLLEKECLRAGLTPFAPLAIVDAMDLVAKYVGEWDPVYGKFKAQKLAVACEKLGVEVGEAHDALEDVEMTIRLVRKMAEE